MRAPVHMAVYGNDFIFVADLNSHRVLLLSPVLTYYIREVVSCKQPQWLPRRLSLDIQHRRLYVAINGLKDGKYNTWQAELLLLTFRYSDLTPNEVEDNDKELCIAARAWPGFSFGL